jgi:acetyl esterase/lipase
MMLKFFLCGCALLASAISVDTFAQEPPPAPTISKYLDLSYGPAEVGNTLNLYIPELTSEDELPLIIWHSGSAWLSNAAKDADNAQEIVREFTARGFAVATISIRASTDAPFPAQAYDVRAAIRWLREKAAEYHINPMRFAFMGNSSGGWAATFAAATSDIDALEGEFVENGTTSAVQAAVAFFPPTDFLSMDAFAAEKNLPQGIAYPHDAATSPESLLILCPDEGASDPKGIQDCPLETEKADPSSYVSGEEVPVWVLHGLEDPLVPYNQSELFFEATASEGNFAIFTLAEKAGHVENEIIGAASSTTRLSSPFGTTSYSGKGPSWDDIAMFLRYHLPGACQVTAE